MEDFTIFTQEDKQHGAYAACVGGMTLVGMGVGRFGGLPGLFLGGAIGLTMGLKACKSPLLQEPIRQKIFSSQSRLMDHEILEALRAIRQERPGISKSDAMTILAEVRVNGRKASRSSQV